MGTRVNRESQSELSRIDAELARLASGYGRARLRMGRQYDRLIKSSGHHELGFSSVAAYSYERCSQSGRWVADTRAVARKLEGLPLLTAALEAAEISWSKVEILVRRATPQTEAELLAEAKSMTVRALRDAYADSREKDEDEERFMTLSLSLAKEDRVLLEGTRMLLTELEDGARGDLWVEALLAEGQTSLVSCVPPGSEIVPDDILAAQESEAAELERMATRRREAERRAEGRIAREIPHEEREASDVEELSDDPIRLDRQLRSDAAELAAREQWMGLLGAKVLALGGWKALGYASERQYCRERLGISRASFRKKIALANGTARFALLEQALLNGTIGAEAALLLARVVSHETEAAWVERAKERTFKHLREEVELMELVARVNGDPTPMLPPDRDDIRAFEAMESDILSGVTIRGALGMLREDDIVGPAAVADETGSGAVQISGGSTARSADGDASSATVQISGGSSDGSAEGDAASGVAVQISGRSTDAPLAADAATMGGVQMMSGGSAVGSTAADAPSTAARVSEDSGVIEAGAAESASGGGSDTEPMRGGPEVAIRIRVREELGLWFRALEASYERHGGDRTRFVQFLCTSVWKSWIHALGRSDKWERVYRRDRYRCRNPVCSSRNSTCHHIKYRSDQGVDEMSNTITACDFCHLRGEHEGRLKIRGDAENAVWILGRRQILVIDDRVKREVR